MNKPIKCTNKWWIGKHKAHKINLSKMKKLFSICDNDDEKTIVLLNKKLQRIEEAFRRAFNKNLRKRKKI